MNKNNFISWMQECWNSPFMVWLRKATTRAVKTVAQSAIAIIGTSVALGDVDWHMVGSAAILAGILSMLTSVAGIPEVNAGAAPVKAVNTVKDHIVKKVK